MESATGTPGKSFKLRIRNAAQLVQVCANREPFKRGAEMNEIAIITNASCIVSNEGIIEAVGPESELAAKYAGCTFERDIDASGMSVVPGLVDGHTHPVWAGDRVHEFAMKLAGATYMEVHKAGGGIGFTVEHTRNASPDDLLRSLLQRLDRMLRQGTTLVEAKSGYGLELDTEVKLLKVLHEASRKHPIELVTTYLGAHSVPKGSTAAAATDDIVCRQIPEIARLCKAGELSVASIDVFCEKGVFEVEDTRRILQAGKAAGLMLNFHGDEINPMRSGELGGELGAQAISHLERVDDAGIAAMAVKPTVAVLLPTTAYILRLEPPPARKLIDGNVPVALGSDFNPNAHCLSMPAVMNFACLLFRMTMPEALVAATINAAASVNKSATHGSIEAGKVADFVVVNNPKWEHLIYEMSDPPILHVIKRGQIVYTSPFG